MPNRRAPDIRTRDALGLALTALWQRRTRTLLTTVGVAVGSFVLLASLAVGRGVQDVILRQLRKQDQLRRISVWPGGRGRPKVKLEDIEVEGQMSDDRRTRLREAMRQRGHKPGPVKAPAPGLTAEQVAALSRLEHVEAVTPGFVWNGTIDRGTGKPRWAMGRTAAEDDPGFARRLVAGRPFEPGEKAIAVSEYLVYQWGFQDEAEVGRALNQPATLNLTVTQPSVASLLFLLNVSLPELTEGERRVLNKLVDQLPQALAKTDLTAAERKTLAGLLKLAKPESSRAVARSLPVVAVYRDVARSELGPWEGGPELNDIVMSPAAARELYFAVPGRAQVGIPSVSVRVDREEYLRPVEEAIKDLGYSTFSLAELLDQIRINALLISAACTLIALISLAVAALGITNTMLMSVLERTFEIGVMKATGARDGEVMGLFLTEGALIGALGALLGLAGAWLASFPGDRFAHHLIATQTPMRLDGSVFVFEAWVVVGVVAAVSLLTTLAAVYPAWRAARIHPVEALRQRG
ncbi:MAG: ABC transporter permease [Gemmataceae bacterium]